MAVAGEWRVASSLTGSDDSRGLPLAVRIVVAPDKFKGSLTAIEAYGAIASGIWAAAPDVTCSTFAMADGGEGTADVLRMKGCERVEHAVTGPLPWLQAKGEIVLLDDGESAILDMASAAGFSLLTETQRDPTLTTTFGVGELIKHAIGLGRKRILVGLGGSATCDGGLGAAQALGLQLQLDGKPLTRPPTGADLAKVTAISPPDSKLDVEIICLCDVDNPLVGPNGAAPTFAPQKGATPEQVQQLDAGLMNIAGLSRANPCAAHTGAAGGLAFGLGMAVPTTMTPGAAFIADYLELNKSLANADLCFTGEGRFDETSLGGKVTAEVAKRAKAGGVRCVVLAGAVTEADGMHNAGVTAAFSIVPRAMVLEEASARASELLARTAEQAMRLFLAGRAK